MNANIPTIRTHIPMAISPEAIATANRTEAKQPQAFFDNFAESVTVYRDDDIWVINKPHGLLSVDGKDLKVSLQSRLLKADPTVKLIHRLDMDTSGIIIFARHSEAQTHISKQFIDRIPTKEYQAMVWGTTPQQGEVDVPVRYDPPQKPKHIVDMNWDKRAYTKYETLHHELRQGKPVSRVALYPVTGRSHQLRVHMLHIGHVMLGDPIYAQDILNGQAFDLSPRLCLHARKLRLKHPSSGIWMDWESDVPF